MRKIGEALRVGIQKMYENGVALEKDRMNRILSQEIDLDDCFRSKAA